MLHFDFFLCSTAPSVILDFCTLVKKTIKISHLSLVNKQIKNFIDHDIKIIGVEIEVLSNICIKNLKQHLK